MHATRTEPTILVVDDESALLRLLKALLDGAGFHVLAARSGGEALRMCRANIDLLLTEVRLPDLTGPELAKQVIDANPDLRVLYMSGSDGASLAAAGFSWIERIEPRLLRKPFSPADLLNAVDGILDGIFYCGGSPRAVSSTPADRIDLSRETDQSPVGANRAVNGAQCLKSVSAMEC